MSDSIEDSNQPGGSGNVNYESLAVPNEDTLGNSSLAKGSRIRAWVEGFKQSQSKAASPTVPHEPLIESTQENGSIPLLDESNPQERTSVITWLQNLWKSEDNQISPITQTPTIPQKLSGLFRRKSQSDASEESVLSSEETITETDIAAERTKLATAFGKAINNVSDPQDRQEIVEWFVKAYDVLATEPQTTQKIARLYRLLDSKRAAKMIYNSACTATKSYKGSNLPLSIKLALPVTTLGACMFGTQGAGIVAFGSGIGLPVVLLLFLGTAGVASIIESLIRDKRNIEPTTRLLLSLVQLEASRRITKELATDLKTDLETPRRGEIPDDKEELLNHLRSMDPFDFERHVMSFFEACGFTSAVTRKSKDKGFDGWVDHPHGIIIVQCKRYGMTNSVGRPDVQQFKGVIEEQEAYHGFFVTTAGFSREALDSAGLSEKMTLIDYQRLLTWHKQNKADLGHLVKPK